MNHKKDEEIGRKEEKRKINAIEKLEIAETENSSIKDFSTSFLLLVAFSPQQITFLSLLQRILILKHNSLTPCHLLAPSFKELLYHLRASRAYLALLFFACSNLVRNSGNLCFVLRHGIWIHFGTGTIAPQPAR